VYWLYRTILFEYHKDGLLGDKYIDDEEMEKVLNEQGEQGWELVSVTPVQEGLLAFFKRVYLQTGKKQQPVVKDRPVQEPGKPPVQQPLPAPVQKGSAGKDPVRPENEQKIGPAKKKPDMVGEIKIS